MAKPPDITPTIPRMKAVVPPNVFWLVVGKRSVPLGGRQRIGRSNECEIVVDDPLASRQHAELAVGPDGVVIRDLGSANGTFVNRERLHGERLLRGGERLRVGAQHFDLVAGARGEGPRTHPRDATTIDSGRPTARPEQGAEDGGIDDTAEVIDVFAAIRHAFGEAVARRDYVEAERLLNHILGVVREEMASAGRLPDEMDRGATDAVLQLAEGTLQGRWLDTLIEIFHVGSRLMPMDAVDRMYSVIQKVDRVDRAALERYADGLRARADRMGPSERFVCKRIEGLVRVATR